MSTITFTPVAELPPPAHRSGRPPSTVPADALAMLDKTGAPAVHLGRLTRVRANALNKSAKQQGIPVRFTNRNTDDRTADVYAVRAEEGK